MDIREKYIDFMLNNIIGTNMKVQLPSPQEDGRIFYVKLGPTVFMNVEFEVIEKYTRSVKFKFKFDKYEVEKIIFIPIESSPMSIKEKLNNTLEKLVYKTFVEDGRRDVIKQMYDDKRNFINSQLKTVVGKIKEFDEYGDDYKNYLKKHKYDIRTEGDRGELAIQSLEIQLIYTQEAFINKIKTDDEFAKKWVGMTPEVEIDNYDNDYKNYQSKFSFAKRMQSSVSNVSGDEWKILTKDEFIEKLKTDDEFNKKWVGMTPGVEVDVYGDLYKNYETKTEMMMGHGFHGKLLSKDEFIDKLKTDDEFNKTWCNPSNKIVE